MRLTRRERFYGAGIALLMLVLVFGSIFPTMAGSVLTRFDKLLVGSTANTSGLINLGSGSTAAAGVYFGPTYAAYVDAASKLHTNAGLYIEGNTTLGNSNAKTTTIAGNTTVGGTLGVTGLATVGGTLGVTGVTTLGTLGGVLKGTAGVVSAVTPTTSADFLGGDVAFHTLNQAAVAGLTTASTPTFAGAALSGATTLGGASTDAITCTGRLVLRTLLADPLNATPGARPAGTVNEIAVYGSKLYLCTNASTPLWILVGPAA